MGRGRAYFGAVSTPVSHVVPIARTFNAQTCLLGDDGPWVEAPALRAMYAEAVADVRADTSAPLGRPGYRLFFGRGRGLRSHTLSLGGSSSAVLGRHERCDVHLEGDGQIGLRHLLLRAIDAEGGPTLDIRDLRAELPFFLHDETPHRSLTAQGALAFRLGRYGVVAVPVGKGVPAPPSTLPDAVLVGEPVVRRRAITTITLRPAVSALVEVAGVPNDAVGRMLARRGEERASVWLAERHLERGVLVGRYPRCVGGGIREILRAQVSRAHVLVLREAGEVVCYDLCSTNGMVAGGRRVRRVRMAGDLPVALAGKDGVELSWQSC